MGRTSFGPLFVILMAVSIADAATPFEVMECERDIMKAETLAAAEKHIRLGLARLAEPTLKKVISCFESGASTGTDNLALYEQAKELLIKLDNRRKAEPGATAASATAAGSKAGTFAALPGSLKRFKAFMHPNYRVAQTALVREGVFAGSRRTVYIKQFESGGRAVYQAYSRGDTLLALKYVFPVAYLTAGQPAISPQGAFQAEISGLVAIAMGWNVDDGEYLQKLREHDADMWAKNYFAALWNDKRGSGWVVDGALVSSESDGTDVVLQVEPVSTSRKLRPGTPQASK